MRLNAIKLPSFYGVVNAEVYRHLYPARVLICVVTVVRNPCRVIFF